MAAAVPAGPPPTTSTSVSAKTGISRAGSQIGPRGPRTLLPARRAAEHLQALLGADAAAVVAGGPGAVLEDFRFEEEASAVLGAFVVRHARFPCPCRCSGLARRIARGSIRHFGWGSPASSALPTRGLSNQARRVRRPDSSGEGRARYPPRVP